METTAIQHTRHLIVFRKLLAKSSRLLDGFAITDDSLRRELAEMQNLLQTTVQELDTEPSGEQIHDPVFYNRLTTRHPDLNSAELRLCALLRHNLSSKEIANILSITPDSVRVARSRLRKKIKLQHKISLVRYFMAF